MRRRLPLAPHRRSLAAFCLAAVGLLASCGGSSDAGTAKVATLQADSGAAAVTTTTVASAESTQEAWLAFAACMRENGVDMADPTFDADGNVQGGFGPGSGVDFRDESVRTALDACQENLAVIRPAGAGPGGGADREQRQAALVSFTECLRDNGLQVDDIEFGGPPGGGGPGGDAGAGGADGSVPAAPPGGFGGSRPERPAGGDGFDPTARIIEQLGLDENDPAVTKALEACQAQLEAAFTRPDASATTTEP